MTASLKIQKKIFIFYQTGLTPHMACLARALVEAGHDVSYVSKLEVSPERRRQGWEVPDTTGVKLVALENGEQAPIASIPLRFPKDAVHLTQGICRNGAIQTLQPTLRRHHLCWGAMLETIEDQGWRGRLRRIDYARRLKGEGARPDFLLATGERTTSWLADRGFPQERIFPFTYFLEQIERPPTLGECSASADITVGFTGQMIERKRLDVLIEALARLGRRDLRLRITGGGPLENQWHALALKRIGAARLDWRGKLTISEARDGMASLDFLVLPSRHDGWGAVVSEALLAGTPAVCSDACGASEAVRASGIGGVFKANDVDSLCSILTQTIDELPRLRAARPRIAAWARVSFSIQAGAAYLESIVRHLYGGDMRPQPPWRVNRPDF